MYRDKGQRLGIEGEGEGEGKVGRDMSKGLSLDKKETDMAHRQMMDYKGKMETCVETRYLILMRMLIKGVKMGLLIAGLQYFDS